MRTRGLRPADSCASDDDGGFTLAELLVAMGLISGVLLSLLALQVSALTTNAQAKERQQATALGNQVMEQLRSLPYDVLAKGLNPAGLTGDPNVGGGTLMAASLNEPLVLDNTGVTDAAPLAGPGGTNLTSRTDGATDRVTYEARAYVSRPVGAAVNAPFSLTVAVSWDSTLGRDRARDQLYRSQAFSPSGCLSTTNRPFSGPCQAFLYGDAVTRPVQLSVTALDPASDPMVLEGAGATALNVSLTTGSAGLAAEQTTSLNGRGTSSAATTSVGQDVQAGSGGVLASTRAGNDPAAVSTAPVTSTATLGQSAGPLVLDGSRASLLATMPATDSGPLVSSAVGNGCRDITGVAMSGRPCSRTDVQQGGAAVLELDLKAAGGRNLPAFSLASVLAPPTPSTSWSGRYLTASGTARCAAVTGSGCVAAGAKRSLGAVVVGRIPAAQSSGDSVPNLPDGLVTVTGYADEVGAEAGPASTALIPTSSRTGTVKYLTTGGYVSQSLAAGTTLDRTLPTVTGSYATASGTPITVVASGTLSVKSAVPTATVSDAGCSTGCTKQVSMPSVLVSLTYVVWHGTQVLAQFAFTTDLGASVASTSYKAAPSV